MDTITILEQAKELGLSLSIDDDKLNVTGPKTPEAAALVAQMAQHKAAVIVHLTQPPTPAPTSDLAFDADPSDDAPTDPRTLPSIRNLTGKPSLPANLWVTGLSTFAEARRAQQRLSVGYGTALGKDGAGYFVRCPGWQWDPA